MAPILVPGAALPSVRSISSNLASHRLKPIMEACREGAFAPGAAALQLADVAVDDPERVVGLVEDAPHDIAIQVEDLPRRPARERDHLVDHRAVDGRQAAGFLESLKATLEA